MLETVENPYNLFALAEWALLHDTAAFFVLMGHYGLCGGSLYELAMSRTDLDDYKTELSELKSFGLFMATELAHGNNLASMETTATYDQHAKSVLINTPNRSAAKVWSYAGLPGIPRIAVVLARLVVDNVDRGVHPFLVRISNSEGLSEGVTVVRCPATNLGNLDVSICSFDRVSVDERNLLVPDLKNALGTDGSARRVSQGKAFTSAMSRIEPGRIAVASASVSAGRASLYIALRYSQNKLVAVAGAHETSIISFRHHMDDLMSALARCIGLTLLVRETQYQYALSEGGLQRANPERNEKRFVASGRSLSTFISSTKIACTWEIRSIIQTCRERMGAQGLFRVNRVPDYYAFVDSLVTAEGDNAVLIASVSASLLASGAIDATQVSSNNVHSDISSAEGINGVISLRLVETYEEFRAGVQSRLEGESSKANRSRNAPHANRLAMAYIESLIGDAFKRAIEETRDVKTAQLLADLSLLCSLVDINRSAGWLVSRGVLSRSSFDRIPDLITEIGLRLYEDLDTILDSFGLSTQLIDIPATQDDYVDAFFRASVRHVQIRSGNQTGDSE